MDIRKFFKKGSGFQEPILRAKYQIEILEEEISSDEERVIKARKRAAKKAKASIVKEHCSKSIGLSAKNCIVIDAVKTTKRKSKTSKKEVKFAVKLLNG